MLSEKIKKIIQYINDPSYRFLKKADFGRFDKVDDKEFLCMKYEILMGRKLDIESPKTFNEKLQWLKLYDHNECYSTLVDKYEVKKYISSILGEKMVIPTIGVWNSFDEIDFNELPKQFVLKCTHDSGSVVICKDKDSIDIKKVKNKIESCLRKNYYMQGREWPYKNVTPRILAEKYMTEFDGDIKDYKFFCFSGKVKFFKIDFDRFTCHRANYYDIEGNILPFFESSLPADFNKKMDIPGNLNDMIRYAEVISKNTPFMRVDFYSIEDRVFFGEVTLYPASGFGEIYPAEWDKKIGELIELPIAKG